MQRLQQDTANNRKDDDRGAASEGKREHGDCSESRVLAQLPECVAKILPQRSYHFSLIRLGVSDLFQSVGNETNESPPPTGDVTAPPLPIFAQAIAMF